MTDAPNSTPFQPKAGPGRGLTVALVGVLLLSLIAQAVSSMRDKSVTTDEIMYIAAGYYHLKTGDFQLNMTNTPLIKVISAVPLLFLNPDLPEMEESPRDWSLIKQWQFSREFLYDNSVDADTILFTARLAIVALAVLLGVYVFLWSSGLYGTWAGLFSLFLFSFSPNILAHARLASQDLGLTTFMFLATYAFWRYMKTARLSALIACGVLAGCAMLAKTTGMFLAPVFGLFAAYNMVTRNSLGIDPRFPMVTTDGRRGMFVNQLLTTLYSFSIIGLLVIVMLNVGYGFQGTFKPFPLPEPFLMMLKIQYGTVGGLNHVFFAGKLYPDGLWLLTPASFLMKTPVALTVLVIAACVPVIRYWRHLGGTFLLLSFIGVIGFLFTFLVKSGVGLRYILPLLPVLHVLLGVLLARKWRFPRATSATLGLLSAWYLFSSLSIYPHYLTYFNELTGGPENGYKYLSDSNVDWGQDLKGLAEYMEANEIEQVHLGYFGSADARYYGINYHYLPSVGLAPQEEGQRWWFEVKEPEPVINPEPGVYAISSTLIASPMWLKKRYYDTYSYFRDREPDALIGYSIQVFNVD